MFIVKFQARKVIVLIYDFMMTEGMLIHTIVTYFC